MKANSRVCVGVCAALLPLVLSACGGGSSHLDPGELHSSGSPDAGLERTSGGSDAASSEQNPAEMPEGVTGGWRFTMRRPGSSDADISTLWLTQSASEVTGARCTTRYEPSGAELPFSEQDCTDGSYSGTFVEPELKLTHSFEEDGRTHSLSMDLVVSADYSSLQGTGTSTKCNCQFEASAVRR